MKRTNSNQRYLISRVRERVDQALFPISTFQKISIRPENLRMVDIEINAWSFIFVNLQTNLVLRLISRD